MAHMFSFILSATRPRSLIRMLKLSTDGTIICSTQLKVQKLHISGQNYYLAAHEFNKTERDSCLHMQMVAV